MTTYAVGDVQGCRDALLRLLDRLAFDPAADRLWLVGDLVNRGGQSLELLREVRALGRAATAVLGNHDVHLLAQALLPAGSRKRNDDLERVLEAPDAGDLLSWLRRRPLLHVDRELGFALVHAGLHPAWTLEQAEQLAGEVTTAVRGERWPDFARRLYGTQPACWSESLASWPRLRFVLNVFTRMRYVDSHGCLDFSSKGPPGSQAPGTVPWFELPGRRAWPVRIVFGHWASLGFHRGPGVIALDSGYVWGGRLTAIALDAPGEPVVSIDAPAAVGAR